VPTLPTLIQYSTQITSQSNRQDKEIQGIQIGKEEIKLSLFVDDIILYIKDAKNFTKPFRSHKHFQQRIRTQY
jgi:hypothetical protein